MELLLILAAVAAAFGGACWARMKRARADLQTALAAIPALQQAIRRDAGRLVLIVAGIATLAWLMTQGGP